MLALVPLAFAITAVTAQTQTAEYEYVVIGSGPGGGPLAANLARAGHSVFLIEAGEDHGDSLVQQVPVLANPASEDPLMSWDFYVSHYEDNEQAYRDTKYTWRTPNQTLYVGTEPPEGSVPLGLLYPRTGTLGGCGNHNAMNFALPPDNDWEHIANLTGDRSWSAANMRAHFERIEHNDYIAANGSETETAGHGFDGWLHANRNEIGLLLDTPGLIEHILLLSQAMGEGSPRPNSTEEVLQLIQRDLNRVDADRYEQNYLYQLPLHYDAQRRRSSAQTYLRDTVNELNDDGTPRFPLTISTRSLATRVTFDTTSSRPRATGVEYLVGQALYRADKRHNGLQVGIPMNVTATREVIVAGGTFNTPQILKLSGIGPREELEIFDIPVVVDLPAVGTNMQDNNEMGVVVEAAQSFGGSFANCTNLAPGDPCLRQWREHGTGPYGIGAAPISMLYRSSVSENADADLFYFGAAGVVFDGFYPGYSQTMSPPSSAFWSIVKMQSQNRAGTVKLRSADPQDTPMISFNYFAEGRDHDLQAMAEGVEFVLNVFNNTPPPYGPYTVIQPALGADVKQEILDQAYSHHATSSCPMGAANDKQGSCVNSNFQVHGVDGLRIVDASVFPRVPGGFPVLPTFLLSEKATGAILEDVGGNGTATRRTKL